MIWDETCVCGHSKREHDYGTVCWCCECEGYLDQNDLVPQPEAVRDAP